MGHKIRTRVAAPLLLVGSGQYLAQLFWWIQGGSWVDLPLRRMLAELFGLHAATSGVTGTVMATSPGSLMITTGIGLLAWRGASELLRQRRHRRLTAAQATRHTADEKRWTRVDFRSAS